MYYTWDFYSDKKKSKVVYPGINYSQRTNESFRNKNDKEHHIGTSAIEQIYPEVNMITG